MFTARKDYDTKAETLADLSLRWPPRQDFDLLATAVSAVVGQGDRDAPLDVGGDDWAVPVPVMAHRFSADNVDAVAVGAVCDLYLPSSELKGC